MREKILAVDDLKQWRDYHLAALREIFPNAIIDVADNARNALEKINENLDKPYDLIVSDLQMEEDFQPEDAGEWLIRNIKGFSQYRKSKFIIISASLHIKNVAERLNVHYLSKMTIVKNRLTYQLKMKEIFQ